MSVSVGEVPLLKTLLLIDLSTPHFKKGLHLTMASGDCGRPERRHDPDDARRLQGRDTSQGRHREFCWHPRPFLIGTPPSGKGGVQQADSGAHARRLPPGYPGEGAGVGRDPAQPAGAMTYSCHPCGESLSHDLQLYGESLSHDLQLPPLWRKLL